ncbi:MAG TPA: hypothetical protein VE243_04405, partial [Candidatus Acidoferrum sp.]|nr:hypothetical protein [Candidatus Acidoferrum sp.]
MKLRAVASATALAAAVEIVAVLIALPRHPERMSDADFYVAFARTAPYPGATPRPFSWRLLEPTLVRILSP